MANELNSKSDPGQPLVYQIRIKGHLGREWADWFSGLTITALNNGETLLSIFSYPFPFWKTGGYNVAECNTS